MDHHRDVHVIEATSAQERDFASAALFRRRADRRETPGELIHDGANSHRSGDAHHRDEVVAAGVADLGEGVILLKDRDRRTRSPPLRVAAIARLDPPIAALDAESGAFEELGEADRGLALFKSELGLRVDRARQSEERVAPLLDRAERALL